MSEYFVIDNFTLIASIVVLVIAIGTCFLSPFLRYMKPVDDADDEQQPADAPKLTIVLSPHDELERLERNLPLLLGQKYPAGFQVIVVIDESAHDTEDLLKRMQTEVNEHPGDGSLYYTFIPDSSRYLSRKKLAITVGVKASTTEWVMVTEASSVPASDEWLATMARHCTDANHVVIGYGNYADEASAFKRYERLRAAYYLMREDTHGKPYRTMSHNVMFRKSDFMEEDGFLGNLSLIRGEYDFIVNKYATEGATALVTNQKGWVIDEAPTHKSWMASHIFYMESRHWLEGGARHRVWFNIDQTALHLSLLLIIAAAIVGAVCLNATLLSAAALSLIASIVIRTVIVHKGMAAFGEKVPVMLLWPYEVSLVWRNAIYALRHRFSDKLDFTTHKQ